MKKTIIGLGLLLGLAACNKHTKGRQIIVTPTKEYYTDYYNVYFDPNYIEFMSYESNGDSVYVRVNPPWDVKKNPDCIEK